MSFNKRIEEIEGLSCSAETKGLLCIVASIENYLREVGEGSAADKLSALTADIENTGRSFAEMKRKGVTK